MKTDQQDACERLRQEARRREATDAVVGDLRVPAMKNPPASGIAYSANFARCQRWGIFAAQNKD